jgi:hypothetical protein
MCNAASATVVIFKAPELSIFLRIKVHGNKKTEVTIFTDSG